MTDEERHAIAMNQGLVQCPQCPLGWLQYRITTDEYLCPHCHYNGGWTKAQSAATG